MGKSRKVKSVPLLMLSCCRSWENSSKFLISVILLHCSCISSSWLKRANIRFINLTPDTFQIMAPPMSQPYTHDLSTMQKLESNHCLAIKLQENCLKQVIDLEVSMGIDKCWDSLSPEYLETLGYLATRRYQWALEELQQLVIQLLFELHRMNILATGKQSRYSSS